MHCHKCGVLLDGYEEQEGRKILCTRDALIESIAPTEEEPFDEEY